MKKFLSIIAAIAIIGPSALSVISCGPTIPKDVVLILPGSTMQEKSGITKAYSKIVQEFNASDEAKDSPIKIQVKWEEQTAFESRFVGRRNTPDLYVSYPDAVATYELTTNNTRDMEQTYFGGEQTAENKDELLNKFWSKSLYDEGVLEDKLKVLPLNKSFDMSVINLKIFLELVGVVDSTLTSQIAEKLKVEGDDYIIKPSNLFKHTSGVADAALVAKLQPKLATIAASDDVRWAIREFFKLDENVLDMVELYNNFFVKKDFGPDMLNKDYVPDTQKVYPLGLDSASNKIIMEYADALKITGAIDPTSNQEFLYHSTQPNKKGEMTVTLDSPESEAFKNIAKYFDKLGELAQRNKVDSSDKAIRWGGSQFNKLEQRVYASNKFIEGTMLLTSSSSAGTWAFNQPRKSNGTPVYDYNKDLLTISGSTATGNKYNFTQQGPGLAGFNSIGSNKNQKEELVTKFVKYLLQPKIQNRFAIMAGYIPSTKEALEYYKHYKKGSFDNTAINLNNGKKEDEKLTPEQIMEEAWKQVPEKDRPENWKEFDFVPSTSGTDAGSFQKQEERNISQLLEDFILNEKQKNNINILTIVGTPLGTVVRSAFETVLNGYVYDKFLELKTVLRNDGKNPETVRGQILTNLPNALAYSKVDIRKLK